MELYYSVRELAGNLSGICWNVIYLRTCCPVLAWCGQVLPPPPAPPGRQSHSNSNNTKVLQLAKIAEKDKTNKFKYSYNPPLSSDTVKSSEVMDPSQSWSPDCSWGRQDGPEQDATSVFNKESRDDVTHGLHHERERFHIFYSILFYHQYTSKVQYKTVLWSKSPVQSSSLARPSLALI